MWNDLEVLTSQPTPEAQGMKSREGVRSYLNPSGRSRLTEKAPLVELGTARNLWNIEWIELTDSHRNLELSSYPEMFELCGLLCR